MSVKITGLTSMLAELEALANPQFALSATKEALRTGAHVVKEAVEARAPERAFPATAKTTGLAPGELKDGVRAYVNVEQDGSVVATVKLSKKVEHVGRWVEMGHRLVKNGQSRVTAKGKTRGPGVDIGDVPAHPFFRPAVEETQDEVLAAIRAEFDRQVKSITKV